MPLEGFAERLAGGTVRGWAWDTDAPEQPILVEVFDGAEFYRRTAADRFDEALRQAERRAGQCGFEVEVPPSAGPDLHVLVDGTGHRLRTPPSTDTDPVRHWLDGAGAAIRPALLVHRLCYDLLGRPASGVQLLRFADRTADPYGIVRLVRDVLDEAPSVGLLTHRDIIREAYVGILGRAADQGALSGYGNALLNGKPVSVMVRELISSPEFSAQYGTGARSDAQVELQNLARTLHSAVATLMVHASAGAGPGHAPSA